MVGIPEFPADRIRMLCSKHTIQYIYMLYSSSFYVQEMSVKRRKWGGGGRERGEGGVARVQIMRRMTQLATPASPCSLRRTSHLAPPRACCGRRRARRRCWVVRVNGARPAPPELCPSRRRSVSPYRKSLLLSSSLGPSSRHTRPLQP